MGKTSIEWTDASWNPIVGCTEVSPGCANCYAARLAATRLKRTAQYKELATRKAPPEIQMLAASTGFGAIKGITESAPRWIREVRFLPERLEEPLHWKKPRRIFVCDMGDLFHDGVLEDWLFSIFGVMALCQRHTFQILTKRPDKMQSFLSDIEGAAGFVSRAFQRIGPWPTCDMAHTWPLPNVWVGVSVENQHFADERIPFLLSTPAAVRWISAEPLLGPVRLGIWNYKNPNEKRELLDWVVCGGESGPNARPMHPDWARSLRDQCVSAGVPFFFKQWGEYTQHDASPGFFQEKFTHDWGQGVSDRTRLYSVRVGKKAAGRLLDGREWNEFPKREV